MSDAALFPDLVVNGEVVPRALVAAEAQNHSAPSSKPGWAWRAAARALAIRTLLLQEARRRGIAATPRAVGPGRAETPDEALIRALLEAALDPEPVTEADVEAAWAAAPDRFRAPDLFEAAHILYAAPPEDGAVRAAARRRAGATLAALRADPRAFARIARRDSACGSREAGGALGQIVSGDVEPAFETALKTLAEGAIAPEPVETRHGVHVVRLDARAEGAALPFASARDAVSSALERRAWTRAARRYCADLVAAAELRGVDFPEDRG